MSSPLRLALAGALAVTLAVALFACGGDDEPPLNSGAATYDVTLPGRWTERPDEEKQQVAEQAGAEFESAADVEIDIEGIALTSYWTDGEPAAGAPSVVAVREPPPEGISQDQFVEISLANAGRAFADQLVGDFEPVPDRDVGGEPAPAFDYRLDRGGTQAKRAVFVFRDDLVFTITLTARSADFEESAADLDEILASWTWQ